LHTLNIIPRKYFHIFDAKPLCKLKMKTRSILLTTIKFINCEHIRNSCLTMRRNIENCRANSLLEGRRTSSFPDPLYYHTATVYQAPTINPHPHQSDSKTNIHQIQHFLRHIRHIYMIVIVSAAYTGRNIF
jgi:hypothetical protein